MIQVTNGGAELVVVRGGVTSYYTYSSFKSIAWFQANNGNYIVVITFLTDPAGSVPLKLSLNEVDNQPAWTNDVLGSEEAIKIISGWISAAIAPATGLATEATLLNVLTAVDNMRDYEVRLVVDSTPVTPVTWLEVRYWDAQSGSLGTPVYYLAGSTTPGSPVLPISYINNQTLLSQILAELQGTLDVNITNSSIQVTQGTTPWAISDNGGSITVDGTVAATQSGTWNIASVTGPVALPTGAATETTLSALNSQFTAVTRTINVLRVTGPATGFVPAGSRSLSVFNPSSLAAALQGLAGAIAPGESFSFSAGGENDTLGVLNYQVAAGGSLVINYTI